MLRPANCLARHRGGEVQPEIGVGGIRLEGASVARPQRHLVRRQDRRRIGRDIEHRGAGEECERRTALIEKEFALIVTDHDDDVGLGGYQLGGEPRDCTLALVVLLAIDLNCELFCDTGRGRFFQRRHVELRVAVVALGVQIPLFRLRAHLRTMRGSQSQNDPCHAVVLTWKVDE